MRFCVHLKMLNNPKTNIFWGFFLLQLNLHQPLTIFKLNFTVLLTLHSSFFCIKLYVSESTCLICLFFPLSDQITTEVFLHLRYEGTDCALMVTNGGYPSNAQSCRSGDFRSAFTKRLAFLKGSGFFICLCNFCQHICSFFSAI